MNRHDRNRQEGKLLGKLLVIAFGSTLIAVSLHYFIIPHRIFEGGLIGIGLIFKYLFHLQVGVTFFMLSLPIYLTAWYYKRSFVINNILGLTATAALIELVGLAPDRPLLPPLASAYAGGLLIGLGVGGMLRHHITTDGIDLVAQIFSHRWRLNPGLVIFVFDLAVIGSGLAIMTDRQFVLSLITVTCIAFITTLLTSGIHGPKKLEQ